MRTAPTKDLLLLQYKHFSIDGIARIHNTNYRTVKRWMMSYGIAPKIRKPL